MEQKLGGGSWNKFYLAVKSEEHELSIYDRKDETSRFGGIEGKNRKNKFTRNKEFLNKCCLMYFKILIYIIHLYR